jgi:hypothetical protein
MVTENEESNRMNGRWIGDNPRIIFPNVIS